MLPVHAHLLRRAVASKARSALPGAPVFAERAAAPAARPRRAVAGALVLLADRVSPEPVERSRWQTG